jgi:hypothetical protein
VSHDAILLTAEQLRFKFPSLRRFGAYLVAVAADNLGNLQITEFPGRHLVSHRPLASKPHVWDFECDGFMLYSKTGGLPDVVAYGLMIVRDRGHARRSGEVITRLLDEHRDELVALKSIAPGHGGPSIAAKLVEPALRIVGAVLEGMKDRQLDAMQGTKLFSPFDKSKPEFSDRILGSICDASLQFNLFDAALDTDTFVDIQEARRQLVRDRLLLAV